MEPIEIDPCSALIVMNERKLHITSDYHGPVCPVKFDLVLRCVFIERGQDVLNCSLTKKRLNTTRLLNTKRKISLRLFQISWHSEAIAFWVKNTF